MNKPLSKLVTTSLLLMCVDAQSQITLAPQFSDGMVLQRDTSNTLSGYSDRVDSLTVRIDGKDVVSSRISSGYWQINLPQMSAGGPYQIEIVSNDGITHINDVLFGDVWFASGQSNMELPIERVKYTYHNEYTQDHFPQIRQFKVAKRSAYQGPLQQIEAGQWDKAEQGNLAEFSAVGYFFAKKLHQNTGVPVAIINNAYGGSRAQGWMSEKALSAFPTDFQIMQMNQQENYIENTRQQDLVNQQQWFSELEQADLGIKYQWQNPNYDDKHWRSISVPGYWSDQGSESSNGVAWYRTEFYLTQAQAQQTALLQLGRIIDSDTAYVNGIEVGGVGYQYPPRRYTVNKDILKPGKNTLVVRIVSQHGKGGFVMDKPYQLSFDDSKVNLAGIWKFRFGHKMTEAPASQFWPHMQPNAMYNAMLAPLKHTKIKGVIWYQGESNTYDPITYRKLFPAMINDWRETFSRPDLPFIFTQLANYLQAENDPSISGWAETRAAQAHALKLTNTAMITAIDVGEWNDIHPLNKKSVGERFALAALNTVYGKSKFVYQGPILTCAYLAQSNNIAITLANPQHGLMVKGEKLGGFAVSQDGEHYQWVDATIEQEQVVLHLDSAQKIQYVRYAWQSNPERANLFNQFNLPAYPAELSVTQGCD
ncbi:sialate O-acetylesterase [Catenovulum agarivorans]|uniref:sialate O-acetylesterase n=1 Tax=Catenovulum agarivorans TaxID=1172192 RepID=UPI0002FD8746|nr:sialate O-acetylesterase [Catenovulum agarivorans]